MGGEDYFSSAKIARFMFWNDTMSDMELFEQYGNNVYYNINII